MNASQTYQTQLWVSDQQTLHDKTISFLQEQLCSNNACNQCATCNQINEISHPWVQWMQPERTFSVDQIDTIIKNCSFQLDPEEKRFIILQDADNINISAANRLLKTIEEPYQGYHFILLTQQPELLPSTITSRCVIQKFTPQHTINQHQEIMQPFTTLQFNDPVGFIKQIDALSIKENETRHLTNAIFEHWSHKIKKSLLENKTPSSQAFIIIETLKQALAHQPMPGGTKLFWKNLYITMHHAQLPS